MNKLRWTWFLIVATPINIFTTTVLAIFSVFFRIFLIRNWGGKAKPTPRISFSDLMSHKEPVRDFIFADNPDTHNLMCQVGHGFFYGNQNEMFANAVTPTGSLYRHVPYNQKKGLDPSLDCLAAACYFYVATNCSNKISLERLAKHHWDTCFNLENHNGTMSGRCANAGVQFLKGDSWPRGKVLFGRKLKFGISKPMIGQNYLTTAALLSLAAKELRGIWKYRYWFWKIISVGFFHERYPWFPCNFRGKSYVFCYVGHVSMMSLYVLRHTGRNVDRGMKWCVLDNQHRAGLQPYMAGMAAHLLTNKQKQEALNWLLSRVDSWPQHFPGPYYTRVKKDFKLWSMMQFCAHQLLAKPQPRQDS